MFRSLHIAATGMAAQETQLDTIANNLANSNTTGYKKQQAEFEDLLYQNVRVAAPNDATGGTAPTQTQVGSGTRVVATTRYFGQGPIQQTNNPLDVAIQGNGFIAVQKSAGETAYTRAGSLKLDATGRLTTSDGYQVEPPITIPADATSVTIAEDGTVSAMQPNQHTATRIGQIQLTTFANPNGLTATGNNLFSPSSSSGEPAAGVPGVDGRGTLLQGSLEGANVEVVDEMIGMIKTQRAYEINSKVVEAADQMLQNATQIR